MTYKQIQKKLKRGRAKMIRENLNHLVLETKYSNRNVTSITGMVLVYAFIVMIFLSL